MTDDVLFSRAGPLGLILLNRPFVAGDRGRVAGIEGTVAAIELRYTAIVDAAGQRHLVPNAKVLSEVVTLTPAAGPADA